MASLSKWLSGRLWTKWLWVQVQLQSLKLQILWLFWARSSFSFRQLLSVDSLWNAYVTLAETYSPMYRTDYYSQESRVLWSVCLNGWVFVYELSGCGFVFSCSHLTLRLLAWFEWGLPFHSSNYRVWNHSERGTWDDKNIQSNAPYR